MTRRRLLESGAVLSASGLVATTAQGRVGDETRSQRDGTSSSLSCGATVTGELTSEDASGFRGDRHYQDEYTFEAETDEFVATTMQATRREARGTDTPSSGPTETQTGTDTETATGSPAGTETPVDDLLPEDSADPYLYLLGPDRSIVGEDDDGGGNFDSLSRNYELQQAGTYTVIATSFAEREFFEYNLTLQCGAGGEQA